ncbi:MAG: PaaI family thioesterase [Prevotella sp.]
MDLETIKKAIGDVPALSTRLGMEFVSTSEPDVCVATMPVNEHTRQPYGVLSGGATLALAETLAGAGSIALCPGQTCVGINVSANHVKSAYEGDTVTARARIINQSKHLHVWQVEVSDSKGMLVSSVQVTNFVKEATHE